MIKEKKIKTKYNYIKTKSQIFIEYLRTVLCAFFISLIFTGFLAIHARNEMIKDIFSEKLVQNENDRKLAIEIITQTDLIKDIKNKNSQVCMHAGEIYETAGDYKNAQMAYELAIEKSKNFSFTPYYRLICVLVAQENFSKADALLENIIDKSDKNLIKFKTRAYLTIGDKYYSIGKFLSAAKSYEKARFYYDKFSIKDNIVDNSIKNRIVNSYINVADIMVKTSLNSEAVRFLQKAEKIFPDDFDIRYKLAIILSESDPEKSVEYIESLLEEAPQKIDYNIYNSALMKAANIADLDGRPTQAKYYRYKIHSIDLFINRKVIYKNDIEVHLKDLQVKKNYFTYPIKATYDFVNTSNIDLFNLYADFVLVFNNKPIETITKIIADKNNPMYMNSDTSNICTVKFKTKIFTKKDFEHYTIQIYLYKDKKFKTYIGENKL